MSSHQRVPSGEVPSTEPYNPASNSTTWTSDGATERTRLQRLHNIGNHIGVTASPFYPRSVQEYNRHNTLYAEDKAAYEKKKLDNRLAVLDATTRNLGELGLEGREKERERMRLKVGKLMGGLDVENCADKTTVLAKKSIWAAGAEIDGDGGWPSREEYKWEGESQARQGLARHFPLPKEEKLRAADRNEMLHCGDAQEVAKMERGERAIPFPMKEVKEVEQFDETEWGKWDRTVRGIKKWEPPSRERTEQISDEEALEKGLISKDLFDGL